MTSSTAATAPDTVSEATETVSEDTVDQGSAAPQKRKATFKNAASWPGHPGLWAMADAHMCGCRPVVSTCILPI